MKGFRLIILFLFIYSQGKCATYYARTSGSWGNLSTWSTISGCSGSTASILPGSSDSVVINCGYSVTVSSSYTVKSVTVVSGTLNVGSGGRVTINTSTGFFTLQGTSTFINNTTQVASTSIFKGIESFSATSTVQIDNWSSTATPLINSVEANFGNVILNYNTGGSFWNNNGLASSRVIQGSLTIGSNCKTYLDNTNNPLTVLIGGSVFVNGELHVKELGNGNTNFSVVDLTLNGSNAKFYGINNGDGNFIYTGQTVNVTTSTFYGIYNGIGNITFNFDTINHSSAKFYGIFNDESSNAGNAIFNGVCINYADNDFIIHNGCNTENDTVKVTLTGDLNINYASFVFPIDDHFSFCYKSSFAGIPNTTALKVVIGGSMNFFGGTPDFFYSNLGSGNESFTIAGNLSMGQGQNYFNGIPGQTINGHDVLIDVGGNFSHAGLGAISCLSTLPGSLTLNVAGSSTLASGTLTAKASTGSGTINFNGPLTINGNITFYLYNDTAVSNDIVTVNVSGSFLHTNGVINFCNNTKPGGAVNIMNIKSSTVTIGPQGSLTRGLAGSGSVFGQLNFNRVGTTNFSRQNGHDIQQVKQVIAAGTTLNVNSGDDFQVASHTTAGTDYLTVYGTLNMQSDLSQIKSNNSAANSGVRIMSGGRLRTQNTYGLYNNSGLATIDFTGAMDYYLDPNSTVEMYGNTPTKKLTGIGIGIATGTQHKYGILEINHTGTPNSTWVYPFNANNVYVRTQLILTAGALNLANSAANPGSSGRTIVIENSATNAITRTSGYIRSETTDLSASVKWQIGSGNGIYIVPFGFSSTNYIPVIFNVTSGSPGDVVFATYHTGSDNLPWPPGVSNLDSPIGLTPDNRDATVDRFWKTTITGSATSDITLNYATSELPITPYDDANTMSVFRFNTGSSLWDPPFGGQTSTAYNVSNPGTSAYGTWAIANQASPLPVELLRFSAVRHDKEVHLLWATASETENDHFIVQRSADLKIISEIGMVEGAGNSNDIRNYFLADKHPLDGLSYYRLKQVDINGTENFSDWVAVKNNQHLQATVYPNPASDYIYIDAGDLTGLEELRITDVTGKLVHHEKLSEPGFAISVSQLPEGTYTLQMIGRYELRSAVFFVRH